MFFYNFMAIEKVQIVESLKTNMASNKHESTLSLKQALRLNSKR